MLNLSQVQITIASILIGILIVFNLVVEILIIFNLSRIRKYTNFVATKFRQLTKLTSDNQIFLRGIYNQLDAESGVDPKDVVSDDMAAGRKKTARRKKAVAPKAEESAEKPV